MVLSVSRIRPAMPRPHPLHPLQPRSRATRHAWLWCLAVLLVLKAAVPLLAAAAAVRQGVPLAQVCTVYGVRTVPVAATAHAGHALPDAPGDHQASHGTGEHCALVSLAAGPLPDAVPAVQAHAPPQARVATTVMDSALPADAALRWLSARLHAPPVSSAPATA
jgi:hypothetical protein